MKTIRALKALIIVIFMELGTIVVMVVLAIIDSLGTHIPRAYQSIKKHIKMVGTSIKDRG